MCVVVIWVMLKYNSMMIRCFTRVGSELLQRVAQNGEGYAGGRTGGGLGLDFVLILGRQGDGGVHGRKSDKLPFFLRSLPCPALDLHRRKLEEEAQVRKAEAEDAKAHAAALERTSR